MFGLLRTTLALLVVLYHLFFRVWPLGAYPVFGFYVISGYLMTVIMHQSYGYSVIGRSRFALNRFLRLYPLYWSALLFSAILILVLGEAVVTQFHWVMRFPDRIAGIGANMLMVFPSTNPFKYVPRLVPPAWALTVELFFYALICLGLSRTPRRVAIWFAISLLYVAYTYYVGAARDARYFPLLAAALPFSIGSGIYFVTQAERAGSLLALLSRWPNLLFALLLANCGAWYFMEESAIPVWPDVGFYLNVLLVSALICSLAAGGRILGSTRRFDSWIGKYSYPFYLLHFQVGLVVSFVLFGQGARGIERWGLDGMIIALISLALTSFTLLWLVDRPVQKIRAVVKSGRFPGLG